MKAEKGFIALISLSIAGIIATVIVVGIFLSAVTETDMSLISQESNKALALANLCAEQALFRLVTTLNYSGNESIIIEGKSCEILSIEGTGNFNRVIKTQSTVSKYTKKIKIEVSQISPVVEISSWEEVSDF